MKNWKKISSRYVLRTPWLSVRKDAYRTPRGNTIDDHYILERSNFVVIVPRTDDGKYILIRQFRHGPEKIILNFPMGFIKSGERPRKAALRELDEEIGQHRAKLNFIGCLFLSPTFTTMKGYVFLATGIRKSKDIMLMRGSDPDAEVIEIIKMNKKEIGSLFTKKERTDFVTACAYLFAKNRSR